MSTHRVTHPQKKKKPVRFRFCFPITTYCVEVMGVVAFFSKNKKLKIKKYILFPDDDLCSHILTCGATSSTKVHLYVCFCSLMNFLRVEGSKTEMTFLLKKMSIFFFTATMWKCLSLAHTSKLWRHLCGKYRKITKIQTCVTTAQTTQSALHFLPKTFAFCPFEMEKQLPKAFLYANLLLK